MISCRSATDRHSQRGADSTGGVLAEFCRRPTRAEHASDPPVANLAANTNESRQGEVDTSQKKRTDPIFRDVFSWLSELRSLSIPQPREPTADIWRQAAMPGAPACGDIDITQADLERDSKPDRALLVKKDALTVDGHGRDSNLDKQGPPNVRHLNPGAKQPRMTRFRDGLECLRGVQAHVAEDTVPAEP
jgi:hypothetical protein